MKHATGLLYAVAREIAAPFRVEGKKVRPETALVFDSPHSWPEWPQDCPVPRAGLMSSWDAWVDELWAGAVRGRGPLLAAHFHRAYIDANRARDDIDPELLDGVWPGPIAPGAKSRAGMGLIRRYALPGVPMYEQPLPVAEVARRIADYYDPYHKELADLIQAAQDEHGFACHIDCHSMKSIGNAMNDDGGKARPDIVVSDLLGKSTAPALTEWVAQAFSSLGYRVQVNDPYRGAELIRRHGCPAQGRHSVQVEINRALYMNETALVKTSGYSDLARNLQAFVDRLSAALAGSLGATLRSLPEAHLY